MSEQSSLEAQGAQKETRHDPAADLAFLRQVAEEGRRLVTVSGGYMVLWGAMIGAAHLLQYFQVTGAIEGPGWLAAVWWFGAVILGYAGTYVLVRRDKAREAVFTLRSQVYAVVWQVAGVTILIFALATIASPAAHPTGITAFGLFISGLGFAVTAYFARIGWLYVPAVLGWLSGSLSLFVYGSAAALLVGAVSYALLISGSGLLLMLGNRLRDRAKSGDHADLPTPRG